MALPAAMVTMSMAIPPAKPLTGAPLLIPTTHLGVFETVEDPENGVTHYEYDSLGRMTKLMDPRGNETRYEYDANGNQIAVVVVVQPSPLIVERTEYEYDAANRIVSMTSPDNIEMRYEYDTLGRQNKIIRNYVDGAYNPAAPDEDGH